MQLEEEASYKTACLNSVDIPQYLVEYGTWVCLVAVPGRKRLSNRPSIVGCPMAGDPMKLGGCYSQVFQDN